MKYILILIFFEFSILSYAQNLTSTLNDQKLKYEAHLAWLKKDGGKWESPNSAFDPKQEWSATSYGYTFSEGYSPGMLKIQITGKIKDKNYIFWEGYYYWDAVKNQGRYFAVGTSGQLVAGETINDNGDLYFEITSAEGLITKHIDKESKIDENQFKAEAYIYKDGKWNFERSSIWTRVRK